MRNTSYKHTLTVYMRTAISLLAGCGCTNETCDSSRDRVRFEFTSCAWTIFFRGNAMDSIHDISADLKDFVESEQDF